MRNILKHSVAQKVDWGMQCEFPNLTPSRTLNPLRTPFSAQFRELLPQYVSQGKEREGVGEPFSIRFIPRSDPISGNALNIFTSTYSEYISLYFSRLELWYCESGVVFFHRFVNLYKSVTCESLYSNQRIRRFTLGKCPGAAVVGPIRSASSVNCLFPFFKIHCA